ncbi:MAG: hypothetical protein K9I31_05375 [Chitinophagaceae bacterium]|jgi:hypothetical protein|nr:hypothetical protein [Chitinophagaceae bacterium]
MERVAALVEKLTTQLAEKADKSQLKQTAVQLLAALSETDQFNNLPNNVSVMIPGGEDLAEVIESPIPEIQPVEVRIPSLPKLEPVKASVVPLVPVEPASIPMEINATISNTELQEKLALDPIKDLKAGIGTNDKFQFIASLFGGDEKAFDQAIKTINGFKIYAEAQFWIKSNLREQNKWEETDDVVKAFDLLVKRRFA